MPGGLVREVFYNDTTWTAPGGVTQVTVKKIPLNPTKVFVNTTNITAINCCCDGYSWGSNICGAQGVGSITAHCQPTCICCGHKWQTLLTTATVGGDTNNFGIDTAGLGYAWGSNICGVLGVNNITVQCTPQPICCGTIWKKFVGAFSNAQNAGSIIGMDKNNCLWGWGDNASGQLGIKSITVQCQPQPVCCGCQFKNVFAGGLCSFYALACDGSLWSWGLNAAGELGIGSITNACQPTAVCCGLKFLDIQTGAEVVFGITCTNDLYAWGINACGVLGNNSITNQCQPQPVCCGLKWSSVCVVGASSSLSVFGVTTNNIGYAWGANACGILGINSVTSQCKPQPICCGLAVKNFYASYSSAFLVDTNGCGYSWGNNLCGALGINSITSQCQPQPINCGLKFDSIASLNFSTFGFATNGCLWSWGNNPSGILGLNSTTVQCQPQPVCCAFNWFVTSSEVSRVFTVTPGFVYTVQVNNTFQGFGQSANVSNDIFAQAVIIEYFA